MMMVVVRCVVTLTKAVLINSKGSCSSLSMALFHIYIKRKGSMQSKTFSQSSSQSKKNAGIRGAQVGAALGARYGPYPYSILIGESLGT